MKRGPVWKWQKDLLADMIAGRAEAAEAGRNSDGELLLLLRK